MHQLKRAAVPMRTSERGVAAVEFVAMSVGVIGLLAILGATAYHALGCERGVDNCAAVAKYLRLP